MKKNQKIKHWLYGALVLFLCVLAYPSAYADFIIEAQLVGDPREENPDYLVIDIDISVSGAVANWVIDINSPLHPNTKLDEFYFNLYGLSTDYNFTDYDPTGWEVSSPATVQGGGTGASTFLFEVADPSGPPNAADITNSQNLSFTMTKSSGDLLTTDFLEALTTSTAIGNGQLGAHLQSLNLIGDPGPTTDSGFLIGDYTNIPPLNTGVVPEPGTMILLGFGLISLAGIGRRKIKK